jgi:hypothetical protein
MKIEWIKIIFIYFISSLSTLAAHRHRERLSKGLRYFSKKVCNKVQAKKITSYNEVATELVGEYTIEEKRSLQLPENDLVNNSKVQQKNFLFIQGLWTKKYSTKSLWCN